MALINNPASRLCEILRVADSCSDNISMKEVWGSTLGCENPRSTVEVLDRLAEVMRLIHQAKKKIIYMENVDQKLYLGPLDNLEAAFNKVNLEEPWKQFKSRLDVETRTALKFCAELLSRESDEHEIDESLLAELQTEVNDLLEKVLKSALPIEVKDDLVGALEELRVAILEYRIRGVEALKQALKSNIGAVILNKETIDSIEDEQERGLIRSIFEMITKLDGLVSLGLKAKQLAEPVLKLLSLPSGDN